MDDERGFATESWMMFYVVTLARLARRDESRLRFGVLEIEEVYFTRLVIPAGDRGECACLQPRQRDKETFVRLFIDEAILANLGAKPMQIDARRPMLRIKLDVIESAPVRAPDDAPGRIRHD